MILDRKMLEYIVSRIRYKTNYKLHAEFSPQSLSARVVLEAQVPNSYHSDQTVTVISVIELPLFDHTFNNERDVINYIRDALIVNLEMHEVDEWFKYDGQLVRDPHA